MEDIESNELEVGDTVITTLLPNNGAKTKLVKGYILGFTDKQARISYLRRVERDGKSYTAQFTKLKSSDSIYKI